MGCRACLRRSLPVAPLARCRRQRTRRTLHGFCMVFACLHDMILTWFFARFCMVWLHDVILTWFFYTVLHVMWLNPNVPLPPDFFSCQAVRVRCPGAGELRGRAVPSGHLGSAERALVTKRAERAQCRAGTSN